MQDTNIQNNPFIQFIVIHDNWTILPEACVS